MIEDCLAEPGNSGEGMFAVCMREVQKDLKQSAKRLIENKLIQHGLGEADGFKVFEECISAPKDGLIIFKGMNNYTADSIKSLEGAKRAWWEEAHTATQGSINLLRPTMRAPGSQLWWSYNPRVKADPVDLMSVGEERPTGIVVVNATWRDNPWWTAELEQERLDCLRMQPDQYEHIYEGGYQTVASGAYYAADLLRAKQEKRIGHVAADPLLPISSYHDIGGAGARADAYSIWITQKVAREIRVLNHYTARGQPLGHHVSWMRENGYAKAEIVLPHDGLNTNNVSGKTYEDHWRDAGFHARSIPNQGMGAAKQRIEATRRLFPRIWFNEKTTADGRISLGWYHPKVSDDDRRRDMGPDHDWSSHDADAFGLMAIDYLEPSARAYRPKDMWDDAPGDEVNWRTA